MGIIASNGKNVKQTLNAEITDKKLLVYLWYIVTAKGGNKVLALLLGQWNGRYESRSLAMIALANHLGFWANGDIELAYRMFRCSKLYEGSKDDAYVWNVLYQAKVDIPIIYSGVGAATQAVPMAQKNHFIVSYIISVMFPYNKDTNIDNYIDWYSSKNNKPYCLTLPSYTTLTPKDTSTIEMLRTLLVWDDAVKESIQAQADITLTTEGVALVLAIAAFVL